MKIEDAENSLRELTAYLSHDRIGKIVSETCQNLNPSLFDFSDENKVSMMGFALKLKDLKQLL